MCSFPCPFSRPFLITPFQAFRHLSLLRFQQRKLLTPPGWLPPASDPDPAVLSRAAEKGQFLLAVSSGGGMGQVGCFRTLLGLPGTTGRRPRSENTCCHHFTCFFLLLPDESPALPFVNFRLQARPSSRALMCKISLHSHYHTQCFISAKHLYCISDCIFIGWVGK